MNSKEEFSTIFFLIPAYVQSPFSDKRLKITNPSEHQTQLLLLSNKEFKDNSHMRAEQLESR